MFKDEKYQGFTIRTSKKRHGVQRTPRYSSLVFLRDKSFKTHFTTYGATPKQSQKKMKSKIDRYIGGSIKRFYKRVM